MKVNELDELDRLIIKTVSEHKIIGPSEVYRLLSGLSRKISRAVVWSRLTGLVESGYLELVRSDDGDQVKSEFVLKEKT